MRPVLLLFKEMKWKLNFKKTLSQNVYILMYKANFAILVALAYNYTHKYEHTHFEYCSTHFMFAGINT